jgi:hypothetical protein
VDGFADCDVQIVGGSASDAEAENGEDDDGSQCQDEIERKGGTGLGHSL